MNENIEIIICLISLLCATAVDLWQQRHHNSTCRLLAPLLWLFSLTFSTTVAQARIGEGFFINFFTYALTALGGFRLAFLIAPSRRTAWLALGAIYTITVASVLELRAPIANYLNSYALTLNGTRFSLLHMLEGVTLVVIAFWATRVFYRLIALYLRGLPSFDPTVREWLLKFIELSLYFFAAVSVLLLLGIDITALAVFSGAIGVGLGLGLQKTISNYISGLILLFEKTVKVGDVIELEGGPNGRVYRLDPRGTFILCGDGKEVIVPNEEFVTKKVTNWTYSDRRGQISIPLAVPYGTAVEQAQKSLIEAAREHPLCLATPAPTCHLTEFGSYAIHLKLQFWIADVAVGMPLVQSEVMSNILRKFQAAGIEMHHLSSVLAVRESNC